MDIYIGRELFEICVLGIIENKDCTGYEISKVLEPYTKVLQSRIYSVVKRLESKKMITVIKTNSEDLPKNYYHITDLGLKKVKEFKDKWKELFTVYEIIENCDNQNK